MTFISGDPDNVFEDCSFEPPKRGAIHVQSERIWLGETQAVPTDRYTDTEVHAALVRDGRVEEGRVRHRRWPTRIIVRDMAYRYLLAKPTKLLTRVAPPITRPHLPEPYEPRTRIIEGCYVVVPAEEWATGKPGLRLEEGVHHTAVIGNVFIGADGAGSDIADHPAHP